MRTSRETQQINNFLGHRGFATLNEGAALVEQLAFMIEDHDHFRRILTKVEPVQRQHMYEAIAPRLRFEAKPLDVYVSEAAASAEARQLPTLAADGSLQPFHVSEVKSDAFIIEQAISEDLKKHRLTLTCIKCTRVEEFRGVRKIDAVMEARNGGWTYDELRGTGREICPKCPGSKN